MRLSVMHNLYFYNKLMERIRQALDEGRFEEFRRTYSERLDRPHLKKIQNIFLALRAVCLYNKNNVKNWRKILWTTA